MYKMVESYFTKVEPFGESLYEKLQNGNSGQYDVTSGYNANQEKYVFRDMYSLTKTAALTRSRKK